MMIDLNRPEFGNCPNAITANEALRCDTARKLMRLEILELREHLHARDFMLRQALRDHDVLQAKLDDVRRQLDEANAALARAYP